ncbi:MAG: hypothetical protein ACUVTH_08640, partial [Thermogutta sp.]
GGMGLGDLRGLFHVPQRKGFGGLVNQMGLFSFFGVPSAVANTTFICLLEPILISRPTCYG